MSESAPLVCDLSWDKFAPGYLRYKLGPAELTHSRSLYHGPARVQISKGHSIIILRNLMLAYPRFLEMETLINRIYPDPDLEPERPEMTVRAIIGKTNKRLPKVGLRISNRFKFGYRLEFIPGWEGL